MTNSDQTHPLGDEETDQINPAVESGLRPEQLDWLRMQSAVLGRKKLQILRQCSSNGLVSIWSIALEKLASGIPSGAPWMNS